MSSGQEQADSVTGVPPPPAMASGGRHAASGSSRPDYQDDGSFGREYPIEGGSVTATGFTVLAATLMVISGLWSFFMGLAAIIKNQFFVTLPNYSFRIDITSWGWIHLAVGALVFIAGVCLILGQLWARIVGVVLALISAVANFLFIPYYPVWSLIVIAIDLFIIWALMTGGQREPA
jgi:hypothetical protein